jgi:peptidyl-prolyl cis-trans isomerase C
VASRLASPTGISPHLGLGAYRGLAAAVVLAMSTGAALAVMGKTTTDVALRTAPTAQAELILNLSEGTLVNVGRCSRGWCGVTWDKYGGYVRQSALQFQSTPAGGPPAIPVYPPYPYKAGHYPTADAYYDLPPYTAIDPSFYRWRFFMMAQERNRYRYMPHRFRGYSGYREDTVGSYAPTPEPASKPMSPESPPKAEPSPAGPAGVLEPKVKKEDTGSSGEPGPAGSPSPQANSDKPELTPALQPPISGSDVVTFVPNVPVPSVPPVPAAEDAIVARVNDAEIVQSDLDSAASELGARLAGLSEENRGLVLLEFNIENQLMAEDAEKQNLAAGRSFEGWPNYQRRRALRDMYFDKNIRGSVSDQAIKELYNEKIAQIEREPEVRVRQILVPTEAEAKKVAERLKNGEDFVALAKEVSKDPSSEGGALGFVRRGELIAPVEDAVFALKVGQISKPVQTQFGWNIFELEEKRQQPPPTWDTLRDQLEQQEVRAVVSRLRRGAKIEVLDIKLNRAVVKP